MGKRPYQPPILVRKTESRNHPQQLFWQNHHGPEKQYPLHLKPNPLRKCRLFRTKSVEERKALLKDKHVFFKCCSSANHIAKAYKNEVQCSELGSKTHLTALHPGPLHVRTESTVVTEIMARSKIKPILLLSFQSVQKHVEAPRFIDLVPKIC